MDDHSYRRVMAGETLTHVLSPRALWRMIGPDAERYLNGQVTNDITKLPSERAFYAAVCTAKGRMEGDIFVARHTADFYVDAAPELRESLGLRLDKYLIADDAVLEDISETWSLSHVFGETSPPAPASGFVIPHARYGVAGFDVWMEGSLPLSVGDRVEDVVLEILRIEHGLPRWGAELTTQTLPPEAGPSMLDAISYTKGCYVGQETIARLKSVGHVNRSLVLLLSASASFPAIGAKLMHDGKEAGAVTSSSYSPYWQKGIALGYVPRLLIADGTSFDADGLVLTARPPLKAALL